MSRLRRPRWSMYMTRNGKQDEVYVHTRWAMGRTAALVSGIG